MGKIPNYKTSLYSTWEGMRSRCNNSHHWAYPYYGGRGIKVCIEWNLFTAFARDMGERPFPGATIDRKDNNGDYEPSNCRWATKSEQSLNARFPKNNKSGARGVFFFKRTNRWAVYIDRERKRYHLGFYLDKNDAIEARTMAESLRKDNDKFMMFIAEIKRKLLLVQNAGQFKKGHKVCRKAKEETEARS
jgi:hypothetical protein